MRKKNASLRHGLAALAVGIVLLAADQITKYYVLLYLRPVESFHVVPYFLDFCYVENRGAAFGLFQNSMWLVGSFSVIVFVVLLLALFRYKSHTFFSYCAITLIFSGGIGNLIDRLRFGFVVDFIHVLFFDYVFNFADCCVTVGAVLLVCHAILLTSREKKQALEQTDKPAEEEAGHE